MKPPRRLGRRQSTLFAQDDIREIHLEIAPEQCDQSAANLLAEAADLSIQRIKEAMNKGAVWISRGRHTRRLRRYKAPLHPKDQLHLYFNPEVLSQRPPEPMLIADEGDYSVWYKPFGLRSQGSKWGDHTTLSRWVEVHLKPQRLAFSVHRLDRAASGLMLLAHGKGAARQLADLFQTREIDKRYLAIVHGLFQGEREPLTLDSPIEGRDALSHVRLIEGASDLGLSLVEIHIETGRKHQIRIHLSGIGHPILGDRLHGCDGDREDLALAAVSLGFICPVTGVERHYVLSQGMRPSLDAIRASRSAILDQEGCHFSIPN